MVEIRLFEDTDAQKVADMINESLIQIHASTLPVTAMEQLSKTYSPEGIKDMAHNRKFFVAIEMGEIVGTVTMDENNLSTLFIKPQYQNNGVKEQIMDYVEKKVSLNNYSHIKINAGIVDTQFLEARGYKKQSDVEFEGKIVSFMMAKAF